MQLLDRVLDQVRQRLSQRQRQRLRRIGRPALLGTLRRTTPLSDAWGFDRGTPIDRYYLEQFLSDHRADITGRTLEVKDDTYTARFGRQTDEHHILDIDPTNARATIVADLAAADDVAAEQFDCFVLTQTLHLIYDLAAAVRHAHRLLRPGGVLLVTVPTTSRIIPRYGLEVDHWRLTPRSCGRLFGDQFGPEQIQVRSYGNALTGIAFLTGMAAEELTARELAEHDPYFPLLVAVRAVKA